MVVETDAQNDRLVADNSPAGVWRHGARRHLVLRRWCIALCLTLAAAPALAHVSLDYPNGGEQLEVGSVVQILWSDEISHGPATYDLWYSTTGPDGPWISIAGGLEPPRSYDWVVPDTPSNLVRFRVRQDNDGPQDYYDISDSDVAIVEPLEVLSVVLDAEKDATIYEDGEGTDANGSGSYIFSGRAAPQNSSAERRALLVFPITGDIPGGSTITSVSLELTMSRTTSGAQTVGLHRILEAWSEGPSDPPGQEGGGASAMAGDVTWIHREFPGTPWSTAGGSFAPTASATLQIAGLGSYSFSSSPELVADVQGWLDDPSSNFGWALVVTSPPSGSAKRFNSRENVSASSRPRLTVSYQVNPEELTADFIVTPATPRPGDEVQFNDTSTGGPMSWSWDFGDGQTSQQQHPTHTYTSPGSVTVTLEVSNASGDAVVSREIRISSAVRRPSRRTVPIR